MFNFYWEYLGYPLSKIKGEFIDALPFSVVEILSWLALMGTVSAVLLLPILVLRTFFNKKGAYILGFYTFKRILLQLGVCGTLGLLLAWGQGIEAYNPWPSFNRKSLTTWGPKSLEFKEWKKQIHLSQAHFLNEFDSVTYVSITEFEILELCNQSLGQVLQKLQLPKGRELGTIKTMGPLNTFFALTYGGPAFHDPLTGEVGIISAEVFPTTRAWRHLAICHETTHAMGFTREIDTEILTYLLLIHSDSPYLNWLASWTFLAHSGLEFSLPPLLEKEATDAQKKRKEILSQRTLTRLTREFLLKNNLDNSSKKYGFREKEAEWNPQDKYFSSVDYFLKNYFYR